MKIFAFILICLFPAYLIRFDIGPLPSTVLELSFGIFFLVWLLKYARNDQKIIRKFFTMNRWFAAAFAIFFLASVTSIFTSDMWWYSFGQWRAYFLEPMILFVIFLGRREELGAAYLSNALLFSTLSITLFGIFQKVSGFGLSSDGRVTSFFTSPNAVGLYLAPIIFLAIPRLGGVGVGWRKIIFQFIITILCLVAIFFTKSLGTIIALCGGLILLLWLTDNKRRAIAFLLALIIAGALVSPFTSFVASKDQSSANRLILWQYSMEYLTASPKNFIFGAGIRQFFRKIQKPHYDAKELERLIYPHNIFLNFWTETGLFGMLSFTLLYCILIIYAINLYRRNRELGACLLSALVVFLIHGLVDVPYFKNDLAMLFWTIAALTINATEV
ncbi:MAG: O-antigen ligase family protein [Patescibacteria group bacterium]